MPSWLSQDQGSAVVAARFGCPIRRGITSLSIASFLACLGTVAALAEDPLVVIPGGASPLTLDACVEAARTSNGSLRAEQLRADEVRARITQTLSEGFPTVELAGSWNRSRDPSFALDDTFAGDESNGEPGTGLDSLFSGFLPAPADIPAQTFWRASVNATWEIRPGRIYNALRAVGSGIAQQEAAIVEAEHRTVEEVLHAYSSVHLAGAREAALLEEADAGRELLEVARRRLRLDLGTPLDTLQAAVALANLGPELRRAHQSLEDFGAQLNLLMGRDPLTPLTLVGEPAIDSGSFDPERFADQVVDRPDLQQRRHEIAVLRRNRGAKKALHRPYLSMDGSYGYVGRSLDTVTQRGHDFWSARLSLVVPIFDGLLTRGQVRETEAAIRRTREELAEAEREAWREVLSLHGNWIAANQDLAASRLNDRLAEDALAQTQHRYELGKSDYLGVLNSQSERFRARSNLIEARHQVITLLASLKRALGFDPRLPLAHVRSALGGGPAEGVPE